VKTVIIALSGKKGSGKDTLAPFITEYFWNEHSTEEQDRPIQLAFADLLKEFCIKVLGLDEKQCYGTDYEKEAPTKFLWENTPDAAERGCTGPMTGRDVMQIFGTESVRAWFGNVWAEATLRKIKEKHPPLAVVTDNRFPSEVETILGHPSGYIIRLTRSPYLGDTHASEVALDDYDWSHERCYVLNNAPLTIQETEVAVIPILEEIFAREHSR
jgi:hypothetical protein